MYYSTRVSHQMQKQNFGVTCPGALFIKTAPDSDDHEKLCIHVSRPGHTEMHYVTSRSHQMQKIQIWRNMSRRIFSRIYTSPTRA
jgi:hypothetical protein